MHLGIILTTILFSAFFSGMEIAYFSANKLRLELDMKQETFTSRILALFSENPGQYIVTMLIGNNISLVVYGIFMAIILDPFLQQLTHSESWLLILQTIISTLIILVLAEFIPKAVFRLNSNAFLKWLGIPVWLFYFLFYPVSRFTIALSNGILSLFFRIKHQGRPVNQVFGVMDLQHLVHESELSEEEEQVAHSLRIFQNALEFSKVKLRECMIPRTELVALDKEATVEEIRNTFVETGLSKILIFENSIDHIIGYLNIKDFFHDPSSIAEVLYTIPIVPESMSASKLLGMFVEDKKGIALVVDEFGGTAGIVTIEDILEEIFGEIEDEHDSSALLEKQIGPDEYLLSGRLEIDYLNNKYQLEIPEEDEYETLAGYILHRYESLPKSNQNLSLDDFEIKILKITETRIDLIKLVRHPKNGE
jgi:CBS domain containing-hemolysin-like protein